jgi:TPP-dependent trihydroxycyclohexane-1,2-dione (THcHDO) dehydratase
MAALAIDIVTLYVAHGEVQRAADAAALVAAKAFVDSGVTANPNNSSLQTLAENMANAGITGILAQNKVAGAAPVLVGTPTFDFTTYPGNPQVTVTLQRTSLPIFFARIWKSAADNAEKHQTVADCKPGQQRQPICEYDNRSGGYWGNQSGHSVDS